MFVTIRSMGLLGLDAYPVYVETDLSKKQMPVFDIIGLPDTAVKESRERVRSSIKNSGMLFPGGGIVVNLAPAGVKKTGSLYDLPILVSILAAAGAISEDISSSAFVGELSLGGDIRPVRGALPMTIAAMQQGMKRIFLPYDSAGEASFVDGIDVIPVKNVAELTSMLTGKSAIKPMDRKKPEAGHAVMNIDMSEVRGQFAAKRALEIAACGGHNILLIGSPGAGKSMLAKRLPTILPEMTQEEIIETSKIHSIAGELDSSGELVTVRPFRSPHHTVSTAGLAGGGSVPAPGEISLAHNGVLFLDELPEFSRAAMEILRQPVEDGKITISRANAALTYPCSIMLVAAMNPCPCGFFGHPSKQCTCTPQQVSKYLGKISGPLLDRFDLHIEVPPVDFSELAGSDEVESSETIRKRVNRVRKMQSERYKGTGISCSAAMTPGAVRKYCVMDDSARELMMKTFDSLGLSARAYDKILKIARTIADMADSETIRTEHIFEAVQYRSLDKKYWSN